VRQLDVGLRGEVPAVRSAGRIPRATIVAFALAAVGCYAPYRPPSLAEPHATVKVHIAYHSRPGPDLGQVVLLNGERVAVPNPPEVGWGQTALVVPVRPSGTSWQVKAGFSHTETAPQTQTVTTMQTVACSDPEATGVCSVPVTETQTVMVSSDVSDGMCARALAQAPQADGVYLLQFDFYGPGRCTLACFRQWPQADGSFRNGPCEAPPTPSDKPAPPPRALDPAKPAPVGGLDVN
jgi:hypothetical protein